jgi:16S rRNA U516 pseudouridylate synthase RsuA-like enzyme
MCMNVPSRLDIPTEGLVLVTNDGGFARQMELPRNQIHRVYRARVHGRLNSNKLDRIRQGFDGYKSMAVAVEKRHKKTKLSANTWVQITSTEGQVRPYSFSTLYRIYCLHILFAWLSFEESTNSQCFCIARM